MGSACANAWCYFKKCCSLDHYPGIIIRYVLSPPPHTHTPPVADIPGLIPGAHLNKGLGHSFLRHVERCKALLWVLDASIAEPDMTAQLHHLQTELRLYKPSLCENVSLVVANKMDLVEQDQSKLETLQHCIKLPIIPVSALRLWNIETLKLALLNLYNVQSYS